MTDEHARESSQQPTRGTATGGASCIGAAALLRIRDQARLQVQGREEGRLIYELLDGVGDGNGLTALPLEGDRISLQFGGGG